MTRNLAMVAVILAAAPAAWAQDVQFRDPVVLFTGSESASVISPPLFGLRAGYIKSRDADDGTWFGGVQARVPITPLLTIEGSIEVHTSEFADGDIEIVQYPVQASLLVNLPLGTGTSVTPYGLVGLGWYYTTTDFSGSLSGVDSDTTSMFGAHLGFGAQIALGGAASVSADLRYIFLEPNDDALEDEDFDTIQVVLSLNFPF